MSPGRPTSFIPRKPLLLLAVSMLFCVPAMFGNLVWWVPTSFIGALLLRFWMETQGTRLRSMILKILLMGGGVGAVGLSYHSLLGPEPGLSICLAFIGVKILEAHTVRDFHVLAALGWFASLAQVMISQTLTISVLSGIAFFVVLAAVLLFHRPSASPWGLLRSCANLMLQALPFILVLFFLFPRGSGGLGFILRGAFSGQSGMSETLSPGSVAGLALSNKVAFRAIFPDGTIPSELYWRAGVLTHADGMTWTVSKLDLRQQNPEPVEGEPVRQRIVMQPHGHRWLFALDKPGQPPKGNIIAGGNVLLAKEAVRSTLQYEVLSFPKVQPSELSLFQRRLCLQLNEVGPSTRALAQSLGQGAPSPAAIVRKALEFFQKGKFRYTLSPGEYGQNALDEFLFRRRTGFCEHYAAAFATLMRAAGVPARIVVGYQGGEFNALGHYVIVRQSNAHAWCEVWMPNRGWQRVDPTAAVGRRTAGLDSLDAGGGSALDANPIARALRSRGFLHNLLLAWDSVNYAWDTRVVGFDEDAQQSTLLEHGFTNLRPSGLLSWLIAIASALLALLWLAAWWKSKPKRDPIRALYDQFCHRASAWGVKREPWEGPQQFAHRALALIPSEEKTIRTIADLYTRIRYAENPEENSKIELARVIKRFCRAPIRKMGPIGDL